MNWYLVTNPYGRYPILTYFITCIDLVYLLWSHPLRPDSLPEKNSFDPDCLKLDTDDEAVLAMAALVPPETNFDDESRIYWTCHLHICTKQASSSRLSAREKADTPTVRGLFRISDVLYMILNDIFGIPLNFLSTMMTLILTGKILKNPSKKSMRLPKSMLLILSKSNGDMDNLHLNQFPSQSSILSNLQRLWLLVLFLEKSPLDAIAESSQTSLPPEFQEFVQKAI